MSHCQTGEQHHHQPHGQQCECQSDCECQAGCQCCCSAERDGCCRDGARGGCRCDCRQGSCCCGGGSYGGFRRRYRSKAEVTAEVESYLAALKAEVQAVEERLKELRG